MAYLYDTLTFHSLTLISHISLFDFNLKDGMDEMSIVGVMFVV